MELSAAETAKNQQKTELDQLILSTEALKQTLAGKETTLEEEKKIHELSEEKLKEMEQIKEALQSQLDESMAERNRLAGEISKLEEDVNQETISRSNESEKNQQIENQLKVISSSSFD